MTQAQLLAQNFDFTRKYTLFFLNKLQGYDLHQRFEMNGKQLNSAYWIMAHLTISQNWLLLRGTGGEIERFSWAKLFGMGAPPPAPADCPPFEEIKETSIRIHKKAMDRVSALSDEQLQAPTQIGFSVGPDDTIQETIMHAARHEAGHAGQLGWTCAMHGIKTV